MPATNPRLTITMQPELAALLRRLSQLTGNSQSALIATFLSESSPVLSRMVEVLEAAATIKKEVGQVPRELAAALERAQGRMEQQLGFMTDDFDVGSVPLLQEAHTIRRRARRATAAESAEAKKAPFSNRGVTTPCREAAQTGRKSTPRKPRGPV